ncbi:hypothetical protein [Marinomonas pollencensis]|uniref:Uncharacterized protein n=1 Tax=Marinomonas pollencensis TaxID=491954 RepID=A0A3E0DLK1_9GAMM|nr:hypothetical protein [Marinomonas pollencensis]REG83654.1 hypothetical protein DFP81_10520 [Marinomonas pollencensis]
MSFQSSSTRLSTPTYVAAFGGAMDLADWQRHYRAESIDLRLFFHSGWSS